MTILYQRDPVTGKTTQKILQFDKDPTTGKFVEQSRTDVASLTKSAPVDITHTGAIMATNVRSGDAKQSLPTTSWDQTSKKLSEKADVYNYLLGEPGKENAVIVRGNQMYVAPINQESLTHGAMVADLTQAREVEYDPYLAEAYRMKRQYNDKYGVDWRDVAKSSEQEKSELDTNISQYQSQVYQQVIRPQRQAKLYDDVTSGRTIMYKDKFGATVTMENPEYTAARQQAELAQRGLVSVNIGGRDVVMTPAQIEQVNATAGQIQSAQEYNKQRDEYLATLTPEQAFQASIQYPAMPVPGGSIYQDLGVVEKPLSKVIQEMPSSQRHQVETQLQQLYEESGRPERSYQVFKNKYLANPNQYAQELYQRNITNYNSLSSGFDEKYAAFEEAYRTYQSNPTDINRIKLEKANADALKSQESLNYFGNDVLQKRLGALSAMAYGRIQPYQSPLGIPRRKRKQSPRKSSRTKKTLVKPKNKPVKQQKKALKKKTTTKKKSPRINRLLPPGGRIDSYNERFRRVSNGFLNSGRMW
jgi:hypothetical protein